MDNELNLSFPDINAERTKLTEDVISKDEVEKRLPLMQEILKTTFPNDTNIISIDPDMLKENLFDAENIGEDIETWYIPIRYTGSIPVAASWYDNDDDGSVEDIDYDESCCSVLTRDYQDLINKLPIKTDCYTITNLEFTDEDNMILDDVEVEDKEYGDAGIGSYEYWGEVGYDSHPYIECYGTAWLYPDPTVKTWSGVTGYIAAEVKKECI